MLVKVKDGMANRLIHRGVRYYFAPNEVKECPSSILSGYRGILVSAESHKVIEEQPVQKMPIIQIEIPKIKIPIKGKSKKKIK